MRESVAFIKSQWASAASASAWTHACNQPIAGRADVIVAAPAQRFAFGCAPSTDWGIPQAAASSATSRPVRIKRT